MGLASLDRIQKVVQDHLQLLGSKPIIGWFCSYTPEEILLGAGLYPYRIVPEPTEEIAIADAYLDSNFCPYARSCLARALKGDYQFLDGLVVVNSCDAMRRLYDGWCYCIGTPFVYLLDLPRIDSELAVEYYGDILLKFIQELENRYGVKISEKSISDAILACNRVRSLLRELYNIGRDGQIPISGSQMQQIVRASTILPKEIFVRLLEELLSEIRDTTVSNRDRIRVLITGSIMDNPLIIQLVEECGAIPVCDDLCTGTRYFWDLIDIDDEPLASLSRYYLSRIPCPRMKEAERRFDHIFNLINDYQIDGVIFYTLKFCDPFLFDIPVLKRKLSERGIPSLILEGDYTPGTLARIKTRIQAFMEMLSGYIQGIGKQSN
jgi:bzd-type benzoyl-CoA reductase N subunit